MRNIIYNTQTNQLSRIYENGYNVPIPAHEKSFIHVLEVIEPSQPSYNTATQRLSGEWVIDTDASQYKKVWSVTDKTAYELACESWGQMDYALRIVAPLTLALNYPQIEVWFRLNNLPIVVKDGMVYLYCNEILKEHEQLVTGLNLTVQNRP